MGSYLNRPIPSDEWWLALGCSLPLVVGWLVYSSKRGWKRYPTVDHLIKPMYNRRMLLTGKVLSVGDGDNFRLYHLPWMWRLFPVPKKGQK
jgi:hypothetical protein